MHKRTLLGLLMLALGLTTARSQETSCVNRKVPVSFRDAQNAPLQNISLSDVEARIKGKPVKFLSLAPDLRPHRIVLALDVSASMGNIDGESLWNLELSLARHFFHVNREKTQIALLCFNDRVDEIVGFGLGNSAVGEVLRQAA